MIIDNVQVSYSGFTPEQGELKNYVDYTKERVPEVSKIHVDLADDGGVDISYTAYGTKFERIRRITGLR